MVERNYDAGAIPGDLPIVVVADLRQMKLEAGVSELDAGRLRVGMKALVAVQAKPGESFKGQLAAISPEVDERNRHFKIDVRVPNAIAGCCRACTPPRASSKRPSPRSCCRRKPSRPGTANASSRRWMAAPCRPSQ